MENFRMLTATNGEFYFTLTANNNKVILVSEMYKSFASAMKGVRSVIENAKRRINFEIRYSKKNEPYFVLKAKNGEIIGMSEMYSSERTVEIGIKSVMKHSQF